VTNTDTVRSSSRYNRSFVTNDRRSRVQASAKPRWRSSAIAFVAQSCSVRSGACCPDERATRVLLNARTRSTHSRRESQGGLAQSEMTSWQARFRSWSMSYINVSKDAEPAKEASFTCRESERVSCPRGIPNEANRASGSNAVVRFRTDAKVSDQETQQDSPMVWVCANTHLLHHQYQSSAPHLSGYNPSYSQPPSKSRDGEREIAGHLLHL